MNAAKLPDLLQIQISFHGPRQDVSRSRVYAHDEVLCASCPRRVRFPCSSAVEAFPDLSCPPRLDWLVLDLLRLTLPHPLFAQGTVASLTRLGRGLVADFAVVALAATLDATVGCESSTQPALQRLSHVAAHTAILNTNDQRSATMFHRCMCSVRAQCFHDNK